MSIENCACGGSTLDRFYSLFVCDHANCNECHWTNNKCCNGDTSSDSNTDSKCLNYYNIKMQNVISSKIKTFGYSDKHKALAIQFVDGSKKLILNVDKQLYEDLITLNKDTLFMHLEQNINTDNNQCIDIP